MNPHPIPREMCSYKMVAYYFCILVPIFAYYSPTSTASCPMDLGYVGIIPWNISVCKTNPRMPISNNSSRSCCQTLTSLFAVGLARYLQQTSLFRFQDLPTSVACLSDFQTKLSSLSLPSDLTSTCFDPLDYVNSTNLCANIYTVQDWIKILGPYTSIDTKCRSNNLDVNFCNECVSAGFEVQTKLISVDGNTSHSINCFRYAVLYAAGIGNLLGPGSLGALSCIFGLGLISETDSGSRSSKKALVYGLVGALSAVFMMSCISGLCLWWIRWKRTKMSSISGFDLDSNNNETNPEWRPKARTIRFKIQELEKATDKFSTKNFIGRGQFGVVHKGILSDGTVVAVKKIPSTDFRGEAQFHNEVEIISTLKHRNLVRLIGYCSSNRNGNNQKYLVYHYMPNGNLNEHLFRLQNDHDVNSKESLTWPQRKSIILDIAKGLAYLHYGVNPAIYHRDIKSTNILLDADMRARLADFGLVLQCRGTESNLPTRAAGTHGYLAPEYALYGKLTEKSDVYSFGIVVLEIMCSRKALVFSSSEFQQPLLITDWAWSLMQRRKMEQVLDPSLLYLHTNPKGLMERFVLVGILCSHVMAAVRPTILEALKMLEGDLEVPAIPDRPLCIDEKIL